MCKFCEEQVRVITNLPEDNPYGTLDSSEMLMLHNGYLRICNIDGRGLFNDLPIFQLDVLYCPYCGKKLKSVTTLTKFDNDVITDNSFNN